MVLRDAVTAVDRIKGEVLGKLIHLEDLSGKVPVGVIDAIESKRQHQAVGDQAGVVLTQHNVGTEPYLGDDTSAHRAEMRIQIGPHQIAGKSAGADVGISNDVGSQLR